MSNILIYDNIHKYINISPLAKSIIDTIEFKRLKEIHQLGTCHHVFLGAVHSRFEHSIGVYHLAGKMLENIRKNNDVHICINNMNETIITDRIIELVQIGGLCHDLGHGPYSHVFDDIILANVEHENAKHELRSCKILDKILSNKLIEQELQFVKDIINPQKHQTSFIYQIVSNNLNSIDVDKFDYLARDTYCLGLEYGYDYSRLLEDIKIIDNKICYPKQTYMHIFNLFMTRYNLHKQIYNHKAVKSIEYMIYDIMILLDPILHITDSIMDMTKFCTFTDNYIFNFLDLYINCPNMFNSSDLEQYEYNITMAVTLMNKIRCRNLYKLVDEYISHCKVELTIEHFLELDNSLNSNDIIISCSQIGYVSGNKECPFDNIYFYNKKNDTQYFTIDKTNISYFISENYQEYCIKVFCRDDNKYDLIKKLMKDILINL